MDHVAIMKKKWKLIEKILMGEKTIESRWYVNKTAPWGKISSGDIIYFKDSGCPVTAKATVSLVESFDNMTSEKIRQLRMRPDVVKGLMLNSPDSGFDSVKAKKYVLLIHLIKPERVSSFSIDKTGFGVSCAWMCVGNISKVKV